LEGDNNEEKHKKGGTNIYFKFIMSSDKSPESIVKTLFRSGRDDMG